MNQLQAKVQFSSIGKTLEVPVINQLMAIPLENPEVLSLAAGFTDNLALPANMVQEIVKRLPETNPNNEYLQYGTTIGRAGLRSQTAAHLNSLPNEKDDIFSADSTFITNGSQQALFLATQTLCDPGDYVLVESPTYFVYLSMLQGLQINPIGIPVDEEGEIDLEKLSALLSHLSAEGKLDKIKAAYLIGYYANPSSRCLSLEKKEGFATMLKSFNLVIPVIEDAAYRELSYGANNETPSILSMDAYNSFPKLYLGTYTKPFATGLKVGYGCCTAPEWFEKMLCAKGNQDFGTSNFSQAIIERVLVENKYSKLIQELGKHYEKKATLLHETLKSSGIREKGWKWKKPAGGLLFWLEAPEEIDTAMGKRFCNECENNGVIYVPGHFCFADGVPNNFIRLSIGSLSDEKLKEAATRFSKVALNF